MPALNPVEHCNYMNILIVEDDKTTADYVMKGLREVGHSTDICGDGQSGLVLATQNNYDVLIVDRMLPGLDGLSMVKALKAAHCKSAIIFLTSVSGLDDRISGLEAGGDDYLVKPFAFSELLARINAIVRRPQVQSEELVYSIADLQLDVVRRKVTRGGKVIELKPKEYSLLELLMKNEGRVITRTMLLERIWEFDFDPQTSVIETQVSRLRNKIDKPFEYSLIHTIRNIGYSIHAPE